MVHKDCSSCHAWGYESEPFLTLYCNLKTDQTLQDSVNAHFHSKLAGECTFCKSKSVLETKSMIEFPQIFAIMLYRFQTDNTSNNM